MPEAEEPVGLAAALEGLRAELEAARVLADGKPVRFEVSEVTMTIETVARRENDGSGRIRWWVVEGGAGVRREHQRTQTLTLTMIPKLHDAQGNSEPLEVHGGQAGPGD